MPLGNAGFKVCILEAGPRFASSEYGLNSFTWEKEANPFSGRKESQGRDRYTYTTPEKLDTRYNHLRSYSKYHGHYNNSYRRTPPSVKRVEGVGATTLHYQGEAHRFSPFSFKYRTLYGVADDWPLSYADLEPYYAQAERLLGVSGELPTPFKPRRTPFLLRAHRLSCASKRIKVGFDRLGLHLLPNTLNILSQSFNGRPACNYCNGCSRGCMAGAKGSMDVTCLKLAEATGNVVIRPLSTAHTITTNKRDLAKGVIYFDSKGVEQKQKAKLVVLSAGALESPRLLLNSSSTLFPDGLANRCGLVGRFFMETIFFSLTVLFAEQIHSYKGLQIDARAWDFNEPETKKPFSGVWCSASPHSISQALFNMH